MTILNSDHFDVTGVYRVHDVSLYIDVNDVDELHGYSVENQILTVGANTSLNVFMGILKKVAKEHPQDFSYLLHIAAHVDLVANVPVRNVRKACTHVMRDAAQIVAIDYVIAGPILCK